MKQEDLARFRELIQKRLSALMEEGAVASGNTDTVVLDQQSVGRLSRMDAMQQQAMAKATQARREREENGLNRALARLDAGTFGTCDDCEEPISENRLEFDPSVTLCISCARG